MNKLLQKMLSDEAKKANCSVVRDNEVDYGFVPTYFPFIDFTVSSKGLFPKGTISEIMGLKSSCKTTLVLHALAEAIRDNPDNPPNILWSDFEGQLLGMKPYVQAIGIDITAENFIHSRPAYLEEGCQFIIDAVKTGDINFVVVDSNAAMRPKVEDKGIGEVHQKGYRSYLISQFIRNLNGEMNALANRGIEPPTVIIINQVYLVLNIGGPPRKGPPSYDSPGSGAIKFYAAARLEVRVRGAEYRMIINPYSLEKEKIKVCSFIELFVEKLKVGVPHRKTKFAVRYGEGVDPIMSFLRAAINAKIVRKKGDSARVVYDDAAGNEVKSFPGLLAFYDFLRDNHNVVLELAQRDSVKQWYSCLCRKLPMVDWAREKMKEQLALLESSSEGYYEDESGNQVDMEVTDL